MKRILIASLLSIFSTATVARAQYTDVPVFDNNGDFRSSRVDGNGGSYQHRQWLIVDTDPDGLNCRSDESFVVATLRYGSVVDSVFSSSQGDAIEMINGEPWLKVSASWIDIRTEPSDPYICYVRANINYIAPINPDSQMQ